MQPFQNDAGITANKQVIKRLTVSLITNCTSSGILLNTVAHTSPHRFFSMIAYCTLLVYVFPYNRFKSFHMLCCFVSKCLSNSPLLLSLFPCSIYVLRMPLSQVKDIYLFDSLP